MSSNSHCFSVILATKVGLECAIILQHFYTWHRGNKDNPDMNKDKRVWFFLSRKSILEVFPYLTDRKIRNSIESLIASGYVVKGNYNKDSFKKANWYSMTDKAIALFEEKSNPLDEKSNDWSKSPLGYSKENIEYNKETIKEREDKFREKVQAYSNKYSQSMLDNFIRCWTEPNASNTKMRFELQQTFEIGRRLATWASKNFNREVINTNNTNTPKKTKWEEMGMTKEQYELWKGE